MELTIFTLGTSNRTPEEFIALLRHYGVRLLADVRRFPTSRFEHFKREHLAKLCRNAGVEYLYLGDELGGYRSGGYTAYMETEAFRAGLEKLEALAREKPTAVTCSERLPWRCHRRFIGRALADRGWHVRHVIDLDREWTPTPPPPALTPTPPHLTPCRFSGNLPQSC